MPASDPYLSLLLEGRIVHVEMNGPDTLLLTFSPYRRIVISVDGDGDLIFAEEAVPTC